MSPLLIFGGTFDPIHHGHLRLAEEMREALAASHVSFIPAGVPPHRGACSATIPARVAMLERALAGNPHFAVDLRETRKSSPSYTVETLRELRAEHPDTPLILLLGSDAFAGLDRWHAWRELFELAHIAVAERPGPLADWRSRLGSDLAVEFAAREVMTAADLKSQPAGSIFVHAITALDISASAIRTAIARGASVRYLLPDAVIDYIQFKRLYAVKLS